MNLQFLAKRLFLISSVLVVVAMINSCGSKNSGGSKTLSSKKGSSGKGGLLKFGKGSKDAPGIANGEIVATNRRGWTQPTPYGMVLVPSGSYMMGQADEEISRAGINFNKRVTVSAFYMDDTEITNHEYRQFTNSLLKDSVSVLGEDKIMTSYYPDTRFGMLISPSIMVIP